MSLGMLDSFITAHWFSAEAKAIWGDGATLQAWLDVEAALARAQADLGLIPAAAAAVIESKATAALFDLGRLAQDIAFAQHPLVPALRQFEELCGEPAAGYIHWGATTQNIFDTATALQMTATHAVLVRHLGTALSAFAELALAHAATPMAGRTHGQHALPTTAGYKLASWMDELDRDRERLERRLRSSFVASMGGAIGTFAAMGRQGRQVEACMAERLGLAHAGLSSRASYDRACDYVCALGLLCGTAQKIAQDVVFLQRTEVDEMSEAFYVGKVGSSTMAQKRNPSTALLLISLSRMMRARVATALESMVRMDEGDSSATNVADVLMPEIAILGASIAETLGRLAAGLVVHPESMRRNLGASSGLISSEAVMMRLTQVMGRHEAHHLLYEAAHRARTDGLAFLDCIRQHPLAARCGLPDDLAISLDPSRNIGESVALTVETVERVMGRK